MPKRYHLCIRYLLQHFNKALNELRLQGIFRFIMFVEYIDKFRRLNSECVQENLTIPPPTYNLRLVKFHCAIHMHRYDSHLFHWVSNSLETYRTVH